MTKKKNKEWTSEVSTTKTIAFDDDLKRSKDECRSRSSPKIKNLIIPQKNVTDTFQNLNLHVMFRIWFASSYYYCSSLITHRLKMLRMERLIFFSKAFQVGIVHSVCGCSYRINISQFIFILFYLSHPTPCAPHLDLMPINYMKKKNC